MVPTISLRVHYTLYNGSSDPNKACDDTALDVSNGGRWHNSNKLIRIVDFTFIKRY